MIARTLATGVLAACAATLSISVLAAAPTAALPQNQPTETLLPTGNPAFAAALPQISAPQPATNLIRNADFEKQTAGLPDNFTLAGNTEFRNTRDPHWAVALVAGKNPGGDRSGSVSQTITAIDSKSGRWFRFSFRGLPQSGFVLNGDQLDMKAEFFAGDSAFDSKSKPLYFRIEQDRKDLSVNGDGHTNGAAVWRTYLLDFYLPEPQIDRVKLSVNFDHATAAQAANSEFFVTDFSLIRIAGPEQPTAAAQTTAGSITRPDNLIPIAGRFFYQSAPGETTVPPIFDHTNADRLIYHDNVWSAPFAGEMSAWLRAGDLDSTGNLVQKDQLIADNVTVTFDSTAMIIHTQSLPNHPTGAFPGENPNYIKETPATYYIPLNPSENPNHQVTAIDNSNHALPMGPIGIAANGVVFFNPFDADSQDASNIMDYCCGHPNPDGLYHYHKYPICMNSPWVDEGKAHSPLLGWAFDGFPIYGPYVKANVLAKDAAGADALNAFNLHTDPDRGPHYQVTPGKFPYIIGGYWGTPDPRDGRRGPGGGGPGGGPGGPGGRGRGPGGRGPRGGPGFGPPPPPF